MFHLIFLFFPQTTEFTNLLTKDPQQMEMKKLNLAKI